MNIKKIMIIFLVITASLVIAALVFVNILFFRELPATSPEPKDKPKTEKDIQPNYAIPSSNVILTGWELEDIMNKKNERRKALEEKELELSRQRDINRAEAFARLKKLENSLPNAETQTPPKKDPESVAAEEMKKMKDKGLIAY